jgi:hypothetical protein
MFIYVDALCLLPLYMYPKTHIARARHLIYFHPDSLLHQYWQQESKRLSIDLYLLYEITLAET